MKKLLVVAVLAAAVLAAPYLALDPGANRLAVRGTAHWVLLVIHIFTAAVALVLGPVQFMRRRSHAVVGRVYLLAGVVPSGLAGIPVAIMSPNGPVTQIGLLIPAVGWLVTAALAYRAARRGDFVAHRAWMIRNYALTFLAVTSRLVVPLMLLAQLPFLDGSIDAARSATIPIGQWVGWLVNLAVAELVLRRKRVVVG